MKRLLRSSRVSAKLSALYAAMGFLGPLLVLASVEDGAITPTRDKVSLVHISAKMSREYRKKNGPKQ